MFSGLMSYVSLGLAGACVLLFGLWQMDKAGARKWKARAEYYHSELTRISTERDEQKAETDRRIGETRIIYRDVEGPARGVEGTPTAPNCATPPAILGADL